jgi:nicotinate-nucleotide adenylyltransferase
LPVCFYFGTFNPIHTGHLILAQSALAQFGFERVVFVPAGQPPHRFSETDLLPASQRAGWVEMAIADNPGFCMDTIELDAQSPSYTVETLEKLRANGQYGLKDDPIPMIIGSDALAKLASWHRPKELIESACFIQAGRPGSSFVKSVNLLNGIQSIPLNTQLLQAPLMSISSTTIRQKLCESNDSKLNELRYLLPEAVRQSLIQNNPYRKHGKSPCF